ncbi:MAG: FAD-dependent monooxygenase [Bacteroidales bacterium]|nr:FAD-dependent monooxygenase [Bacteroidales bacterium]
MGKHIHVAIVGAGPAGSICGYLLTKAGVDFASINRKLFRKKNRKEVFLSNLCYSRFGLWLMKLGAHRPKWIKKAFEMNY